MRHKRGAGYHDAVQRTLCTHSARLPACLHACLPADIDQFFVSLTKQLEDVHHYALRAQGLNETLHTDPRL